MADWSDVLEAWEASGRSGSPWRAGMRYRSASADEPLDHYLHGRLVGNDPSAVLLSNRTTPDPDDPATLGCLLGLVREVTGDPFAYAVGGMTIHGGEPLTPDGDTWAVYANHEAPCYALGPTEYAALCAAIVAGLERGGEDG